MLTFNIEWLLYYPTVFESDDFYKDLAIIAPFWSMADATTSALLKDDYPEASSSVFYQVHQDKPDASETTKTVLTRATEDVAQSSKYY